DEPAAGGGRAPRPSWALVDLRRAPKTAVELVLHPRQVRRDLLEMARHLQAPGIVAEVMLDLPDHRADGVGHEFDAAFRVEAVERVDQADGRHLDQVLHRYASPGELGREGVDEVLELFQDG